MAHQFGAVAEFLPLLLRKYLRKIMQPQKMEMKKGVFAFKVKEETNAFHSHCMLFVFLSNADFRPGCIKIAIIYKEYSSKNYATTLKKSTKFMQPIKKGDFI